MELILSVLIIAILVIVVLGLVPLYIILGIRIENKMLRQIEIDEKELEHIKVIDVKNVPDDYLQRGCKTQMVCGSITIAGNYVRNFFASWKNIFGGEIKSYSTLLSIARRSAMIRMKKEAAALNADCIINIKCSTANIMNSDQQQTGTSIEVLFYGTALIP